MKSLVPFAVIIIASVAVLAVRMTSGSKAPPLSSDVKTMELTFPVHTLSGEKTQYLCSSFVLPKSIYVNKMEIVDRTGKENTLHHLLVLSSVKDFGTCPFVMDMPEVTGFSWGWAIGASNLELSSNQFGIFHDVVVLQIHYITFCEKITDQGSGGSQDRAEPSGIEVATVGFGSSPDGEW